MNLEDAIRFENESTGLDFKAKPYTKQSHESLLRDMLSMANADCETFRRVIVGVKVAADGKREIIGVPRDSFVDAATYQQLVAENIEPTIPLEYYAYDIDNVCVGVFQIGPCEDGPYMMRKPFGGLRKGDVMIRKGSFQQPCDRRDLERMFNSRRPRVLATGDLIVEVVGAREGDEQCIELGVSPEEAPPSAVALARVMEILNERKGGGPVKGSEIGEILGKLGPMFGHGVPYEYWESEELKRKVKSIPADFEQDDQWHRFEKNGHALQLRIKNVGPEYALDATLFLELPALDGLEIADRRWTRSAEQGMNFDVGRRESYPRVERKGESCSIRQYLDVVKHQLSMKAFVNPLRVRVGPSLVGQEIEGRVTIHAKNLPVPAKSKLLIRFV